MELQIAPMAIVTLYIIINLAENAASLLRDDDDLDFTFHNIPKEDDRYNIDDRVKNMKVLKRKVKDLVEITNMFDMIKQNKVDSQASDVYVFSHNKRQKILINENNELKPCELKPILTSTYTRERGSQTPRHVQIKRCQGGTKNPENHQCQPSGEELVECFKTLNDEDQIDYLGVHIHTKCEEKCICPRKGCKNRKVEPLICPKGFKENKATCQCKIAYGGSMFFRNMDMHTAWKTDLNNVCRIYANSEQNYKRVKRDTDIGGSFLLKKV